jgi:hypothetical protein
LSEAAPGAASQRPLPFPLDRSLCATCGEMRRVDSAKGSVFLMCKRADTDPRYAKYPPQPIARCAGHVPREAR